jgi:hypothetical protein
MAEEDDKLSVRDMSIEIERANTEDQRQAFMGKVCKVVRALRVLYDDSESVAMPQPLRLVLKAALEGLLRIEEWGN